MYSYILHDLSHSSSFAVKDFNLFKAYNYKINVTY